MLDILNLSNIFHRQKAKCNQHPSLFFLCSWWTTPSKLYIVTLTILCTNPENIQFVHIHTHTRIPTSDRAGMRLLKRRRILIDSCLVSNKPARLQSILFGALFSCDDMYVVLNANAHLWCGSSLCYCPETCVCVSIVYCSWYNKHHQVINLLKGDSSINMLLQHK